MALKQLLSHIEKIDLRDVRANEAYDFTQWSAEEENLSALADAIGIDLELIETESPIESFSSDIFAIESGSNRKVVVENQLEETDRKHLGQIITYAAVNRAELKIWIVATTNDQHQQAIKWLNEHTDSEFEFFLLEIEVPKTGNPMASPSFNVVEQARSNPNFMKIFKPRKTRPQMWGNLGVGSSTYKISLGISTQKKTIGVGLYIRDDKDIYQKVVENVSPLEEIVGVEGKLFSASKDSGIRFIKDCCEITNANKWNIYIDWRMEKALKLKDGLKKIGL